MRTLGVDACSKGWVAVANDGHAYFGRSIDHLLRAVDLDGVVDVVAIDMPIGLPDASQRAADVLARAELGPRRTSVFTTPVRSAVYSDDYQAASAANRLATGNGISQQAFAICKKIREVDAFVRSDDRTIVEVHPEVSFKTLAGRTLLHPKSTWAGAEERRALLDAAGMLPRGDLGEAGMKAAPDDILDAAVACWSATRRAERRSVSFPAAPERFSDGLDAAIWA